MRSTARNPRFWLGMAISVAALYVAVRGIDWTALFTSLATADYVWLIPSAAVIVIGQVARAVRWQVLFGDSPRPGGRDAFAILSVGYLVSGILPLRLGDPVRAWLVGTHTPASGTVAFGTIMVERAVDLLTVLVLLAVLVPVHASRLLHGQLGAGPWSSPANLGVMTLGLVGLVYLGFVVISHLGARTGRMTTTALARIGVSEARADRVGSGVAGFAEGFGMLRRPRYAALTAVWCVIVWLLGGLQYWFVMFAFHLDLPYSAAVFVLCGTAIFAILPSSPGYVGVFHLAVKLTLAIVAGIPPAIAVSYAIVLHGLTMVVLLSMGLVGLRMIGLSGHDLEAHLGEVEATV
jgi:uncharacterized protein (TIRG00374 family)